MIYYLIIYIYFMSFLFLLYYYYYYQHSGEAKKPYFAQYPAICDVPPVNTSCTAIKIILQ